jgi:hypothetical protein
MKSVAAFAVLGILLQACCSCPQSAESPNGAEAAPIADVEAPAAPQADLEPAPTPAAAAETPAAAPPKEEPKPAKPAVVFTEGMSVADAIKAVPQGAERANIDQETLAIPIQNPDVYEPCKPGPVRIKLKIAVWDGKAVGLDVTATPKNDKVAACVREQILKLSWKARVKSLNIVEYSF